MNITKVLTDIAGYTPFCAGYRRKVNVAYQRKYISGGFIEQTAKRHRTDTYRQVPVYSRSFRFYLRGDHRNNTVIRADKIMLIQKNGQLFILNT